MTEFNNIPKGPHYAIITQESVNIPGDERSRTNPGHGYPAETRYFTNYEAFTDKAKWEKTIIRYSEDKTKFRAFECNPVEVETTFEVVGGTKR